MDTLKLQMEMFNDGELFDYCIDHIQMYKNKELDRLYPKLTQGKNLTPEERRKLEAFCILVNTEIFVVVDEKSKL
jgi:phage terminase small subunit